MSNRKFPFHFYLLCYILNFKDKSQPQDINRLFFHVSFKLFYILINETICPQFYIMGMKTQMQHCVFKMQNTWLAFIFEIFVKGAEDKC